MIDFLKGLLLLLLLVALGFSGWTCWVLWNENQRLASDKAALESERALLRSEADIREAELKRTVDAKESLSRNLVAAVAACDKANEQARRSALDKEAAERALAAAEARAKAAASETAKRLEERSRAKATVDEAGGLRVESLEQLINLTDRAPRRKR